MDTGKARRRRRRRLLQVWILGLSTLALVLIPAVGNPALVDRLSGLVFDLYQQLKPRPEAGAPVIIVDIDEESIDRVGQWPWPRSQVAAIVNQLGALGVAATGFDLVFSEPDRTSLKLAAASLERAGATVALPSGMVDNDDLLAQAFGRNNVVAGFVLSGRESGPLPPAKGGFAVAGRSPEDYLTSFPGGLANLPPITAAATGMGFFSFPPSRDNIVRIVPLVARGQGALYPALSVESLRIAQGAGSFVIRATGASGEADTGQPAMTALKVGELEVPTGPAGEFRVYFSGLPSLIRIPAWQLLDPATAPSLADQVNGKIALIGSSAIGLRDIVATPLASSVAGVNVHAEIIDQILSGVFLTRPDWAPGAELLTAVVLAVALIAMLGALGPVAGAVAAAAMVATVVAVSWSAFSYGALVVDPIVPSITVVACYVAVTVLLLLITDRERQFVRRAFGQYLAPALVERLANDPGALQLGGEVRELTVLFCDIRGFTTLSEQLDPHDLTRLLNRFFTPMTDLLLASGATIDKYVGDQIMAFWNAPLAVEGHAERACLAMLGMQRELDALNGREKIEIHIGIGLNSGPCCVGNLGSEQRFSYSAIGDTVNVAARTEGITKQYGVTNLVTENTAAAAAGLALVEVDWVRVVGRAEPLGMFTVLGDAAHAADPAFAAQASRHREMLDAYRRGAFDEADRSLALARADAPDDLAKLYAIYAERIADLKANPPAAWDGVFTAKSK